MIFSRKKPIPIPDPGQQVRLRARRGCKWRGRWRALSEPFTDARGEAVILVAPEWEYQDALQKEEEEERHRAVGIPWPEKQMDVVVSPPGSPQAPESVSAESISEEPYGTEPASTPEPGRETPFSDPGRRSSWWRGFFGG